MAIIELKNVTKVYGNKTILNKFSMTINDGDFIALMGISGSGKSTLLNIIGLLEDFDEGELILDGDKNISPGSSKANEILREKICYLFQNFALVDDENVEYNLNLPLKYAPGSKKEKRSRIDEALKYVGLENYEKHKIYELSGGEQQRVAIARIMLKPCKIILADEPTGSLDEHNRDLVIDLLKKFNDEGKTVVIVTHDSYVANRCKKIINICENNK
ncbi:ABC transporter ATP-binding protein [Clostridium sp. MSJ-4]|uniref:ABC transporter ATP-binding protein n=1 Tax=Clostridium simiarum TaxID=2841506 RepID=A0ABS6F269_9CLOT|nr:ABC transporter ATP-binding protein [Clostridium simiarum]MBU5591637.1 ABC transporter ATP-binding protein [Clostridium simiarum]